MSGYNKRKANRHENKLLPSTLGDITLGIELHERFVKVCAIYKRVRGVDMVMPPDLKNDMIRWREMMVRHRCKICNANQLMWVEGGPGVPGHPWISQRSGLPRCSCGKSRGDYRHKKAEIVSAHTIADWTLVMKAKLTNQPQPDPIEWPDR